MEERQLVALRNRPQNVTNITGDVFEFKWDGLDYSLEKDETGSYPYYLAEHAAYHIARKVCFQRGVDFNKEGGKVIDEALNKEFIEYSQLTLKKAQEIAKKRKISIEDADGKPKTSKVLIKELQETH